MTALVPSLIQELLSQSSQWLESGSTLQSPPEITTRKWSFMLRFPVVHDTAPSGAILVKISREPGVALEQSIADPALLLRTQREYEMLRSVEQIFSTRARARDFCYVRPLAFLHTWNALIAEELDCKPLKHYLLNISMVMRVPRAWHDFETLVTRSGRWLREYHYGLGAQGTATLHDLGTPEKLREIFHRLSSLLPEKDRLDFHSKLQSTLAGVLEIPIPMAMLHGDFHCSNLIVTPDLRIGALDADCVRGPIYEDIAKLLVDLETRGIQVLFGGTFIRPVQMRRYREVVLQEYFTGTEPNLLILELFMIQALLYKWTIDEDVLRQSKGIQRFLRLFFAPIRRRYLLNLLKTYVANLARHVRSQVQPEVAL